MNSTSLILVFLGLVAVAIYETVTATQLSLPTAPLTVPTVILPFLALANALYTQRVSTARRRRRLANNKPGTSTAGADRPFLTAIYLQVAQSLLAAVLTALLAGSSTVTPCLLETAWKRMFSAHDEGSVRRIQDRLSCCGFNSPRDRAWPFPHGRPEKGDDPAGRCREVLGRDTACREPWAAATRWSLGVELGIVLVVTSFQFVSALMLIRSSYPHAAPIWLDSMLGGQHQQPPSADQRSNRHQQQRRLLANGEEGVYTDRVEEEEGEEDEAGTRGGAGTAPVNAGAQANGPRLEPSPLGGGGGGGGGGSVPHERNEWRDDA